MKSGEDNILSLFDFFWAQRILIFSGALVGALLAGAIAFLITPMYRADVMLSFVGPDTQGALGGEGLGALAGVASMLSIGIERTGAAPMQVAMGKINSPSFYLDFLREEGYVQQLFDDRWDSNREQWRPTRGGAPTDWEISERFERRFSFGLDARTGLIRLMLDWEDPITAVQFSKEFISRANEFLSRQAISRSQLRMQYLEDALSKTNIAEIRSAISGLMRRELEAAMLATIGPEYAFETVVPAIVPDDDEFVRPNRVLLIVIGLLFGGILGVLAAHIRTLYRQRESDGVV